MVDFVLFAFEKNSSELRQLDQKEWHIVPRIGDYLEVDNSDGKCVIYKVIAVSLAEAHVPTVGDVFVEQVDDPGVTVPMHLARLRQSGT